MTWEARCPNCKGEDFRLTHGSSDQLHVNCANPECMLYVGEIKPENVLHPVEVVPH